MDSGMKIVRLMMELQKAIEEGRQEYRRNERQIEELHGERMDAVHDIENCREEDPARLAVARCAFAERYANVSRLRRDLINENRVLEYATHNAALDAMLRMVPEQMTGQMQFLDHAVYHPRSGGGYSSERRIAG